MTSDRNDLGMLLRQRRTTKMLTMRKLAVLSGVSSSHLGRIEKGERKPSAAVLRKLAGPLGFKESELFSLAGFLSTQPFELMEEKSGYPAGHLDPYVGMILSREPAEVQRSVIGILSILKSLSGTVREEPGD